MALRREEVRSQGIHHLKWVEPERIVTPDHFQPPHAIQGRSRGILTWEIVFQRGACSQNGWSSNRLADFHGWVQHYPQRQVFRPWSGYQEGLQSKHESWTTLRIQQRSQHASQVPTSKHRANDRSHHQTPSTLPGHVIDPRGNPLRPDPQKENQFLRPRSKETSYSDDLSYCLLASTRDRASRHQVS